MPTSIVVDGLAHGANPIPVAARRGPLLMTGGIHGADRQTGEIPDDVATQVANAFANLNVVLRAGGAVPQDVVHVTVFAGRDGLRDLINAQWAAMYPDAAARPARHLIRQQLPAGLIVQLEATAWIAGAGDD